MDLKTEVYARLIMARMIVLSSHGDTAADAYIRDAMLLLKQETPGIDLAARQGLIAEGVRV